MNRTFPQPGDGIVTTLGTRGIIRGVNTRGVYAVNDGDPNTSATDVMGVVVDLYLKNGMVLKESQLPVGSYRQETFREHLTRPTGFGKTKWPFFWALQLFLVGGAVVAQESWWMMAIAFVVVNGVLVLGSWMNFKRYWV